MDENELITKLKNKEDVVFINPDKRVFTPMEKIDGMGFIGIKAAQNRLMRFAPFIASAFPETSAKKGVIESRLVEIPKMVFNLREQLAANGKILPERILLKDDNNLPIAGSIKARGGIHEVLKIAEGLAFDARILKNTDDYSKLNTDEFKDFFGEYTIQVGSTGNLGLSIGIMAKALGFKTVVHMSREAAQWKKDLLREKGAVVVEYDGNYSEAVKKGREESEKDEKSFFVDDENSKDLFMGYATSALRLKVQLYLKKVEVDKNHPLFVYIPCGVGGAPGGVTFGIKQMFGDNAHCFFVEPTSAPCMTLGMATGKNDSISIYDIGLDGNTVADGLAVGRPSSFVGNIMKPILSGIFTVSDDEIISYMRDIYANENMFLEPSACAGFKGVSEILNSSETLEYIKNHELEDKMENATHVVWATGGGLVPESEREILLNMQF